ncbi:hypothetical protein CPC08DRAFT_715064 [Agrocybe pediades]|nr:hypothetical protein CPC08DRAFT_715064 [Agrocybe pediades]
MKGLRLRVIHPRNPIINPHLLIIRMFRVNLRLGRSPQRSPVLVVLQSVVVLYGVTDVVEHRLHHVVRPLLHQLFSGVDKAETVPRIELARLDVDVALNPARGIKAAQYRRDRMIQGHSHDWACEYCAMDGDEGKKNDGRV